MSNQRNKIVYSKANMKESDGSQVGMKNRKIPTQAIAKHIYLYIYFVQARGTAWRTASKSANGDNFGIRKEL